MAKNHYEPVLIMHLFIAFTLIIILATITFTRPDIKLADAMQKCNKEDLHTRVGCYKYILERELKNNNNFTYVYKKLIPYTSSLNENLTDLSFHGTNCHVFTHSAGKVLASMYRDRPIEGISLCADNCFQGCATGFVDYILYLQNYSEEETNKMLDLCPSKFSFGCAHGAGHSYFDKYVYNVNLVEDLLENKDNNYLSHVYRSPEIGNLDLAFKGCDKLMKEDQVKSCYDGVTHRIYIVTHLTDHNLTTGMEWCNQSVDYKEKCIERYASVIGIMQAGQYIFSGNEKAFNDFCMDLIRTLGHGIGKKCFKGAGIMIMMVLNSMRVDPSFTDSGNNPVITSTIKHFMSLCKQAKEYSEECYEGMKQYDSTKLLERYLK